MKPLSDLEIELDAAENCRNAAKQTYRENVVAAAVVGMLAILAFAFGRSAVLFAATCVGCVR